MTLRDSRGPRALLDLWLVWLFTFSGLNGSRDFISERRVSQPTIIHFRKQETSRQECSPTSFHSRYRLTDTATIQNTSLVEDHIHHAPPSYPHTLRLPLTPPLLHPDATALPFPSHANHLYPSNSDRKDRTRLCGGSTRGEKGQEWGLCDDPARACVSEVLACSDNRVNGIAEILTILFCPSV